VKGLVSIPSVSRLSKAYKCLESSRASEKQISLWSQWVRFDPRLGEILVSYLFRRWRRIDALELNAELLKQPWPSVFGVLLEQVKILAKTKPTAKWDREIFKGWSQIILAHVVPANHELFFIGLFAFAGKRMQRESSFVTKPYLNWGYLGSETMINKFRAGDLTNSIGRYRKLILKEILAKTDRITVEEYRQALGFTVSQRQAQSDLKSDDGLKPVGFTRNRYYVKSK
jgi:hypothetical protein